MKVEILIHDLNSWGGQDRSMMEIARGLSHRMPVELHSFTLSPGAAAGPFPETWGRAAWLPVRPRWTKPFVLKALVYYFVLWVRGAGGARPGALTSIAVGASAWRSEWVQVQFVHAAWRAESGRHAGRQVGSRMRGSAWALYARATEQFNLWTERVLFRPDRTYIAIAETVKQELIQHFRIPAAQIAVIHHGVDPDSFTPASADQPHLVADRDELRRTLGIGPAEVALLFVGAYERKGLETTIRAFARLRPELRARARLLALGGGDAAYFSAVARECGVADRVILRGVTREVQRYFRAGDVFVLPTLYEPFGLVILEAMSSGLATIVSRRAGGAELIRDGQSGLLIEEPRNESEIARLLTRVLEDEGLRKSLASHARATAVAQSWARVAERYAAILQHP